VNTILNKFPLEHVISLEHNFQAQASMVVKMHTLKDINRSIVKYTGRPMYMNEVVEAVKKILDGRSRRMVLSRGA
jgi:2-oxoglutarate ferredoxin oxidoreductase subunit alpha